MSSEERDGRIVTFYSYKGGTGRSMLLANIAWILASGGKRVLMIDWDLEAPGLHRYFHPFLADKYMRTTPGLVDWVVEYQKAVSGLPAGTTAVPAALLAEHADLTSYLISLDLEAFAIEGMGSLHLLPAGRQDEGYPGRVNRFDWQHLYRDLGGFEFFEAVRQNVERLYDYVLIDSRTGVSDTAGLCTLQMPDTLVVCFTLNSQSIMGASGVARDVLSKRSSTQGKNRHSFRAFPVPTRIERGEKAKLDANRKSAIEQFKGFPTSLTGEAAERYWGRVEVPYESFYAFEEILAVFADRRGDVNSLLGSAERLTAFLTDDQIAEVAYLPDSTRKIICDKYVGSVTSRIDLSDSAEAVVAKLSPEEDCAARSLLLRFVYAHRTGITGLRRVPDGEIPQQCKPVLDRFIAEGIIVHREGLANGVSFSEMVDSELLTNWRRLAKWVLADREFIEWRTGMAAGADAWSGSDRDHSFLMRGRQLEAALAWVTQREKELTELEIAYVMESKSQENLDQKLQADRFASVESKLAEAETRRLADMEELRKEMRSRVAGPFFWRNLPGQSWREWLALHWVFTTVVGLLLVLGIAAGAWFAGTRLRTLVTPDGSGTTRKQRPSAPNPTADVPLANGNAKFDANDYRGAISEFTKAIEANPNSGLAYYRRGFAYEKLNDYFTEINDLTTALRLETANPDPETYFHRGYAYYMLKQYEKSEEDLTKAINLSPAYQDAYFWRGSAYYYSRKYQLAVKDFSAAVRINPADATSYLWLGESLSSYSAFSEAVQAYDAAIRLDPKYAAAYRGRGTTYSDMGKYDLALKDLDLAIQLDPKSAVAYNNRGWAYHLQGQSQKAIANFDQAIAVDPNYVLAYQNRANEKEKLGDKAGAMQDRQKAAQLNK